MYRILIADSDATAREHLRALLSRERLHIETIAEADSYQAATRLAMELDPHAAFVALRLGDRCGCSLAEQWLCAGLRTAVCITADIATGELILRAMRAGARDFLTTPVAAQEVQAFLERVLPESTEEMLSSTRAPVDTILGDRKFSALTERILLSARQRLYAPTATLTAIAGDLGMNSKYLGQVFLRETGMKLSSYVKACRMERARELITSTQEKIAVIAEKVGYEQLNRFYVNFKAYFGISPGDLRREDKHLR